MDDDALSWTGRRWQLAAGDPAAAAALGGQLDIPDLAARCLHARVPEERAPEWLRPELSHLHDPYAMFGMERAVERLRHAVRDGQRVRIVTDYDVDGTTSSLILQNTLKLLGLRHGVDYHIPDRFDEGYGFSERAAERAVADGVDLVLTADIGVRDHTAVSKAKDGGVDVIVCDHHLPAGEDVPGDAHTVLCPPQMACDYPNSALAACGVSLKLAQALLSEHGKRELIVRSLLKMAAIGTVADVVDLSTAENRAIVALGLEQLSHRPHTAGLESLLQVAGLESGPLRASDLGFRVGPRINAAGRLEDASLVVELMHERDPRKAMQLAQRLDQLNRQRQGLQKRLVQACLGELTGEPPGFVVQWGPEADGWHRGIVGIVAAKVRDKVHRPAAIVAVSGSEARGSVRSTPSIHAVHALDSVSDLLIRYGGHPVAAGFSVETDKLPELRERLAAWVDARVDAEAHVPVLSVDIEAEAHELTRAAYDSLMRIGPFGKGNPAPRILLKNLPLRGARPLGTGHLRLDLGGLEAIWWGGAAHEAQLRGGRSLDVVGRLELNRWKGRETLRLTVEDMRAASAPSP